MADEQTLSDGGRMNLEDVPLVNYVVRFGGQDHVLDALLLLGPVLVALVAVAGRSPITEALGAAYVLALPVYVVFKWLRSPTVD